MKIGILGSGTWGTALANMLANMHHKVVVYGKFDAEIDYLNENRIHKNLPGCELNKEILFTTDISKACLNQEVIIFAVPSVFIRQTAINAKEFINKDQIIVTVAKGIEENTLFTMSEILEDVLGKDIKVVALSGPTHAEEVAIGQPTLIVSSCSDIEIAKVIQKAFSNEVLRVYTNTDIKAVELCGALKNIIALAAGMSDGMGFGDNAKAAIITRGLTEITRLGLAYGGKETTFYGLAGIGDIVVTATSLHSRNHNAGVLLGKGVCLEETLKQVGMVVEGINALVSAKQLAKKLNVEMPIVNAVYSIIYEGKNPFVAVSGLFDRKQISE